MISPVSSPLFAKVLRRLQGSKFKWHASFSFPRGLFDETRYVVVKNPATYKREERCRAVQRMGESLSFTVSPPRLCTCRVPPDPRLSVHRKEKSGVANNTFPTNQLNQWTLIKKHLYQWQFYCTSIINTETCGRLISLSYKTKTTRIPNTHRLTSQKLKWWKLTNTYCNPLGTLKCKWPQSKRIYIHYACN